MPVQTKRLCEGVSGAANVFVPIYTTPAGQTTILKEMRTFTALGGVNRVVFSIRSGPRDCFVFDAAPPANGILALDVWTVLAPGDQIVLFCNVAAGVHFRCSGAELDGVA